MRRLTGDVRLEGEAAREALAGFYAALRDYMNFFQPVRKLTGTERHGAKVVRRYDRGRTPYRRLLDEDDLGDEAKRRLTERFLRADPEELQERIDAALDPSRAAREVARRAGAARRPPAVRGAAPAFSNNTSGE